MPAVSKNLDQIDLKILQEIQDDGRITNVELAKRVGAKRVRVTTGEHGAAALSETGNDTVVIAPSLDEAVTWILADAEGQRIPAGEDIRP